MRSAHSTTPNESLKSAESQPLFLFTPRPNIGISVIGTEAELLMPARANEIIPVLGCPIRRSAVQVLKEFIDNQCGISIPPQIRWHGVPHWYVATTDPNNVVVNRALASRFLGSPSELLQPVPITEIRSRFSLASVVYDELRSGGYAPLCLRLNLRSTPLELVSVLVRDPHTCP